MALIKKNTSAETEAPVTSEPDAVVVETAQPEAKPEKQERAVAVKPAAAPPATQGSFYLNTPGILAVIDDTRYGDFPQIIATSSTFKIAGEKTDIGNIVDFQAIATRDKEVCAPGSNDPEAKEYFAAAYLGELTMDGRTIDQCVEDARAAGYTKASKKMYVDLFVRIVDNASDKNDMSGEIVILQLSPVSAGAWRSFAKGLVIKAEFGETITADGKPPVVRATAFATSNKAGQDYTVYQFKLAPV